jgi:hypothetical protein
MREPWKLVTLGDVAAVALRGVDKHIIPGEAVVQDAAKLELEKMRARAEVAKTMMMTGHDRGKQAADHVHKLHTQAQDHAHEARTAQNSDLAKLFGNAMGAGGGAGGAGQSEMPGGTPAAQPEPTGASV